MIRGALRFKHLFFFVYLLSCDSLRTQQLRKVTVEVEGVVVQAEVAQTPEQRERGLMYRSSLDPDSGMLFLFPDVNIRSFWMKNTFIPLDVGYFDAEGFLIEVHSMEPDNDTRTYISSEPAKYALEMQRGWFAAKGLRKYARLKFPEELRGR